MRFLSGVLLFCGVVCSPLCVVGLGCSDYSVLAGAAVSTNFAGLTEANLAAGAQASPPLPDSLSCVQPGSLLGEATRVMLRYQAINGGTYQSSSWQAVGWPNGVPPPTAEQYTGFVGLLASVTATSLSSSTGGAPNGPTGSIPTVNPATVPSCVIAQLTAQACGMLCANLPVTPGCPGAPTPIPCTAQLCPPGCLTPVKSVNECVFAYCSANAAACAGFPLGNITAGGPTPLPPFQPPNPYDILNKFQQGQPPIGTCNTVCPNNLLCVGPTCVSPQPMCDPPCGPGSFCQLNMSALVSFNMQAAAGALANQTGGTINLDGGLSVQAGGKVSGFCVGLVPQCTPSNCTGPGMACSPYVGCVPVPGLIPGLDLGAVLAGGFDASGITANQTIPPGQGNQPQNIPPGVLAQIQAGVSVFGSFVFGAGSGSPPANGSAVTALVPNAQATTQQLLANIRAAALQLANNAQLQANSIQVAVNATLEIVLAGQGARCGANTSMAINGPLVIRGNATQVDPNNFVPQRIFNFPPNAQGNQNGAGGVVNAAGGVGLTGDLGNLTLSINAIAAATAAIAIPPGQFLRSAGQVLGAGARVIVQGALNLLNTAFQPALTVTGSGNVTINVGATGNFTAGPLAIQAGAKIDIWSNGANTFFTNLTQCDASAVIRVRVNSIATLRASGGSGYVFGYGSLNATVKATLKCGAVLYDATGATITLRNTNQAPGRRLLDSSSNTITFGDNNAQYSAAADSSSSSSSGVGSPTSSSSSSSSSSSTGSGKGNNAQPLSTVATGFIVLIAALIHAIMA